MTFRELLSISYEMAYFIEDEKDGSLIIGYDYDFYKDWEITYLKATGRGVARIRLKKKEEKENGKHR